jgi:endonuclease/exonuclease/phosphatase family metal-dependent hydrolase
MGNWEARAPLVLDEFARLEPDAIGLQEIDLMLDQGAWLTRSVNARRVGKPLYDVKHAASPGLLAAYHGIATMAKAEWVEHEVLDLMSFGRVAQRSVLRAGGREFAFVNTHLHHPPGAVDERVRQAERLLEWLGRDARRLPVIIVGDLNAYLGEPALDVIKGRFRSAHEAVHGREPEKTWPTPVNTHDPSPPGTLDYVFASEEFEVVDAGLAFDRPSAEDPDLYPSDHLGVWARVRLG